MANTFIEQIRGACLRGRQKLTPAAVCTARRHPCAAALPSPLSQTPPPHNHKHHHPSHHYTALHEDVERLERLIVKDYRQDDVRGHRAKLMQNHRVRSRLDRIQEASARLLRAYADGEDECEARREEIAALGATDQTKAFA